MEFESCGRTYNPTNNLPSGDCLVLGTRTPIEGEAKSGDNAKVPPGRQTLGPLPGFRDSRMFLAWLENVEPA